MRRIRNYIVISALICLTSCQRTTPYKEIWGEVFHTYYRVVYAGGDDLSASIDSTLHVIDESVNPFNPSSVLYAINNNTTMQVDDSWVDVYDVANQVNTASEGVYDVTVGPLVNAWGFGFEDASSTSQHSIDSLLAYVGMNKVSLKGNHVVKSDPNIKIDFASVAKGYAADCVGRALERHGIHSYMVEIGGEIAYSGVNQQGVAWCIGVNMPKQDSIHYDLGIERVLHLTGCGGVATSGNYRNYKVDDNGRTYAHTISPLTGYPVQSDVLSATVIAPDCAVADAWATALMSLPSERAIALINQQEGIECLLILADSTRSAESDPYQVLLSDNFEPYLK